MFEITERIREGVTVLELKGRLTLGDPCTVLRERLEQQIAAGVKMLVLDFDGVDMIDSSGLGTLVMGSTMQQKAGGALRLLRLRKRQIELMVMTKLSTVFEIFQDETDAINSFYPDRKIKKFDILEFVKGEAS